MNQEKIREVALRVAEEFGYSTNDAMRQDLLPDFLTRCLQEMSKNVEPVGTVSVSRSGQITTRWHTSDFPRLIGAKLYEHPPLTEQDKLDAARYSWIAGEAESVQCRFFDWETNGGDYGERDLTLDAAIDKAMENGK